MRMRRIGWALTLAVCVIGGAYAQQTTVDAVVGKMGNVELKLSDMRRIIDMQSPEVRKQVAGGLNELDRLVRQELIRRALLTEARAKSWDQKADVALLIERAKEQALLQTYMSEVAKPPANFPSEEEVKQAYEANKRTLAAPAQFQMAQIFVSAPETEDKRAAVSAQKKATELAVKAQAKGADFTKLAKEFSDLTDAAAQGDAPVWLPENQLLPEIRAAVGKMEKGDVSAPIRTESGWHIVKVVDKKPAAVRPLSEVRDPIVSQLRLRRTQEIERSYIDSLISREPLTVNQIELTKLQAAR